MRTLLRKKLKVFSSQVLFLETLKLEISQMVKKLIKLLMITCIGSWKQFFKGFVQNRLVEGLTSFFEPTCKAKLKMENEKEIKFLKPLPALKEDCQTLDILFT